MEQQNNSHKIEIHPNSLKTCNTISCSVCSLVDNLNEGENLVESCKMRKQLLINNFLLNINRGIINVQHN